MNQFILRVSLFFALSLALLSCEQGLAPEPPPEYGIAGSIYFRNWPPPDSVRAFAIAALKNYPQQNLITEVLNGISNGTVVFTLLSVSYGDSVIQYKLPFSPVTPGTVQYIGVGRFVGSLADISDPLFWRVAGVYHTPGDTTKAGSVFVPANQIVQVNIIVDFLNPPPQPRR